VEFDANAADLGKYLSFLGEKEPIADAARLELINPRFSHMYAV
jgi:hypothetical protein